MQGYKHIVRMGMKGDFGDLPTGFDKQNRVS